MSHGNTNTLLVYWYKLHTGSLRLHYIGSTRRPKLETSVCYYHSEGQRGFGIYRTLIDENAFKSCRKYIAPANANIREYIYKSPVPFYWFDAINIIISVGLHVCWALLARKMPAQHRIFFCVTVRRITSRSSGNTRGIGVDGSSTGGVSQASSSAVLTHLHYPNLMMYFKFESIRQRGKQHRRWNQGSWTVPSHTVGWWYWVVPISPHVLI